MYAENDQPTVSDGAAATALPNPSYWHYLSAEVIFREAERQAVKYRDDQLQKCNLFFIL